MNSPRPIHIVAHILHALWWLELVNIPPKLQVGWTSYLNIVCFTLVIKMHCTMNFWSFCTNMDLFHENVLCYVSLMLGPYICGKIMRDMSPKCKLLHWGFCFRIVTLQHVNESGIALILCKNKFEWIRFFANE
jgi:hypothetical protein